jgi:hypothetical protein
MEKTWTEIATELVSIVGDQARTRELREWAGDELVKIAYFKDDVCEGVSVSGSTAHVLRKLERLSAENAVA